MAIFDPNAGYKFESKKLSADDGPSGFDLPSLPSASETPSLFTDFSSTKVSDYSFMPSVGDFSMPDLGTKAGELFDSVVKSGSDMVSSFTGLFNGDKTKAISTLKANIPPSNTSTNDISMSLDYNNQTDPTVLHVTLRSQQSGDVVRIQVTPEIAETRSASYEEVGITHHPGQILRYKSSTPRDWSLTAKLISRTRKEASENLVRLNLIRGWVMPYYGEGTKLTNSKLFGAPPDIILFSAYGAKMIPEHPTVLTTYSTTFPADIDYIPTDPSMGDVVPFPVILNVTFTLREAWSPKEFSNFDLKSYKEGNLQQAFSGGAGGPAKQGSSKELSESADLSSMEGLPASEGLSGEPDLSALQSGEALDTSEPNLSALYEGVNSENTAFI